MGMSAEQKRKFDETNRKVLASMARLNDVAKVAADVGTSMTSVRRHLGASQGNGVSQPKPAGKSLADFRSAHDRSFIVPAKIKDGLKQLGQGWEYEVQFAQLCGISLTDLGNYREMFADHFVVIGRSGKRAWSGSKETAEKMRSMVTP